MILTVVIPTHNKLPLLQRTLAALAVQEAGDGRPWDVVVVDDGSSDGTGAWLKEGAPLQLPTLQVVTPAANVGRARARNLGARAASGRWILFLDDDIVAPPGLLAAHLDELEAHPGCGTIGWARTDDSVRDAPHFHYLDTRGAARLAAGPAPARFFVTQNAAVPREDFLAAGGFDEAFTAYGFEDMEVAFRLEDLRGVKFRALPFPVPTHVHHHTLDQYLEKKIECGQASLGRLAVTHPERLAEMRLESVLGGGGFVGLAIRIVADTPLAAFLRGRLAAWPSDAGHRPRAAALYNGLMSLAVVSCFRQGWRRHAGSARATE